MRTPFFWEVDFLATDVPSKQQTTSGADTRREILESLYHT